MKNMRGVASGGMIKEGAEEVRGGHGHRKR